MTTTTIIAGAGISGIRAALSLAELGRKVCLIEKSPSAGGILSKLDHQFPDNHCGMCQMLPMINRDMSKQFCMRKGIFHDNIDFIPNAEIVDVKGSAGQLSVDISVQGTGIDLSKCNGCGDCETVCPVVIKDDFNEKYSERKAVYCADPYHGELSRVIDPLNCTRCGECEKICQQEAINLDIHRKTINRENVDTVILATGSGLYDPSITDLYGFGKLPNVVTSTGFERLISSSGPNKGMLYRPSDRKQVKKIAWLQCVGSRNIMAGADYCSSVCCMFAVKEAVFACEHIGKEADTAIFYMDMRTHGRDFQQYRDDAEKNFGIRFVRCRVHSVEPFEDTDDLRVSFVDEKGALIDERFDLIVLSTGRKQHIEHPGFSSNDGVIMLNETFEFKDIAESLIVADAVAARTISKVPNLFSNGESDGVASKNNRKINRNSIVSGAGPSGLAAAMTLADLNVHVDLIEKESAIGGNYLNIGQEKNRKRVQELIEKVSTHPNIDIHLNSNIVSNEGQPGAFLAKIKKNDIDIPIHYGAAVIATGGIEVSSPDNFDYKHPHILSVFDLERRLSREAFKPSTVHSLAMIQCAGTREGRRNYCSRICCVKALENCLKVKEMFPAAEVYVFYRDMMTCGESEKLYTEARRRGVLFIPYAKSAKPEVSVEDNQIKLSCFDPVLGEKITLTPDILSLATGVQPSSGGMMAEIFNLKQTSHGFIKEVNSKWRPVDTGVEGIFVCGLARAPQNVIEAINEGRAAAVRALRLLKHEVISVSKNTAVIRHALCIQCGMCIEECPYHARYYEAESGRVMVDPVSCQGCGSCAAVCPNSATITGQFEDNTIMEEIESFL